MNKRESLRMSARLAWLASFVLIGCANACMAQQSGNSTTLYVVRRGWHVDVGFAIEDLAAPLIAVAADLPGTRYVFFGFGDRHYLLSKNHNAPVLLSALWPGAGMLLTTGLKQTPQSGFGTEHVIELSLDAKQASALQDFIWKSLRIKNDTPRVFAQGPYEDSVYFLATSKYSALHTCNTWAAEALRAAGLHVRSRGVIFAGQFWSQVRRLKRVEVANAAPRASLLLKALDTAD